MAILPRHTDTFIQKTKKLYLDTRTQRNIAKLNQDIAEVHQIMTRNINDVLAQGERLDSELRWGVLFAAGLCWSWALCFNLYSPKSAHAYCELLAGKQVAFLSTFWS